MNKKSLLGLCYIRKRAFREMYVCFVLGICDKCFTVNNQDDTFGNLQEIYS